MRKTRSETDDVGQLVGSQSFQKLNASITGLLVKCK